ncbi:amino acid permease [Antarcticibacterium flavum]|uniref:Amino acid permease n=1 Tax=Antarcticibacterium flavum TaxID=2058175 RepID=A0A5B7WYC0_9FLAO|nr:MULTISPECIES: amino acid permease [Antarcticibacterium]MCM4158962.1 amino acid permease [Antarcticibacterium sp. W02-3]QCY68214.1 amino acid permease [Antarcticibacterium flavum]
MDKPGNLLRVLSLKDAVGVGLGAIIGAGIFVVTGVAAGIAGPAFLISLLLAGTVATFNALSSAQLAAVYPQSGGTYEYGYRLLNPYMGFAAGWMFLMSKLAAGSVVAIGFGSYFYLLLPYGSPLALSIAAVFMLTLANFFGIKKTGYLNLFIVGLTILALIYFAVSGLPEIDENNFIPFAPFGLSGIAEATALLFFAFTGYARIATLAEEVKEPEITIPRAVIITIASAIILYVLVSLVAVGVVGAEAMAFNKSPLQLVASSMRTPGISAVITLGASTAMLGVLLSQILGISRMMLAMGRRQDLFPMLERVHSKYQVPHLGILFTGLIIVALCLFGTFEFILASAAFTILLYYSITNIAAYVQPKNERRFGLVVPVLGLLGCLLIALSLDAKVMLSGISLLLLGFIIRFLVKRFI